MKERIERILSVRQIQGGTSIKKIKQPVWPFFGSGVWEIEILLHPSACKPNRIGSVLAVGNSGSIGSFHIPLAEDHRPDDSTKKSPIPHYSSTALPTPNWLGSMLCLRHQGRFKKHGIPPSYSVGEVPNSSFTAEWKLSIKSAKVLVQ